MIEIFIDFPFVLAQNLKLETVAFYLEHKI